MSTIGISEQFKMLPDPIGSERLQKTANVEDSNNENLDHLSNMVGIIGGIVAGIFATIGAFFTLAILCGPYLSFGLLIGSSLAIGAGAAVGGFFVFKHAFYHIAKNNQNNDQEWQPHHVEPIKTNTTYNSPKTVPLHKSFVESEQTFDFSIFNGVEMSTPQLQLSFKKLITKYPPQFYSPLIIAYKTAKEIEKFGITDQAALIEIAKFCAKHNGRATSEYIKNFGIKDQAALIEIAKLCAKESGFLTSKYIKNFGITDQAALIEITRLCAEQGGLDITIFIEDFKKSGIIDQATLIEFAKLCAKQSGLGTAVRIKNFGITDQAGLIEIAKLCAEQNDFDITIFIHNFGITDQAALIEIAKLCAKKSGLPYNIKNFGIKDQAALIEIAKLCAKHDGFATAKCIEGFGILEITNQAALVEIAKLCAQQSGMDKNIFYKKYWALWPFPLIVQQTEEGIKFVEC